MNTRIGDLLIKQGLITEQQLLQAKELATQGGGLITSALVKLNAIEESLLFNTISRIYGLQIINLDNLEITSDTLSLISHQIAVKHTLVPIVMQNNILTIAMADPSNIAAVNDIRFVTGKELKILLAKESEIKTTIEKHYEGNVSYDSIFEDLDSNENVEVLNSTTEIDLESLEKSSEDAPVVKLVNAILTDAIKKGASDIHIEPYEKVFRIRFRIDGILYEIMRPPLKLKNALTSRLKIMADLDIAERRLPQDGRIKLKLGARREMDFRVSVLPGLFGEKVVLRLLDKQDLQTDMTKLGFSDEQFKLFLEAIEKPYGMVLVTGPTGSGKTTTLYSALSELNKPGVNICTAEDPVEFNLLGINQTQIHDDIGLNFAAALRSFLRQDPDIILVGEVRDYETAEIAIKASLTGHLVLSTLHTNDAPSTINRLLNMGVEPFLVSSSLNIIVAQRLARRVCETCKERIEVNPEILINLGITAAEAKHVEIFQGKGCQKCSNTGYKGRIALYECLTMTEKVKALVINGASAAEIKKEAVNEGMKTLRRSGIQQLKLGITTVEEILRVTAKD